MSESSRKRKREDDDHDEKEFRRVKKTRKEVNSTAWDLSINLIDAIGVCPWSTEIIIPPKYGAAIKERYRYFLLIEDIAYDWINYLVSYNRGVAVGTVEKWIFWLDNCGSREDIEWKGNAEAQSYIVFLEDTFRKFLDSPYSRPGYNIKKRMKEVMSK